MAKKDADEPMEGSMPVNDAWTGLLAISLIALGVATGFLAWDWMQYDEEAVTRMKIPKLAGAAPKKAEGDGKKADGKKADDGKKAEEKKEDEKKDDEKEKSEAGSQKSEDKKREVEEKTPNSAKEEKKK